MTTPKYKHDCTDCTSLGTTHIKGETYDLYACQKFGSPLTTLIARYGDAGPHYYSATAGAVDPQFSAAALRIAQIAFDGEYYDQTT